MAFSKLSLVTFAFSTIILLSYSCSGKNEHTNSQVLLLSIEMQRMRKLTRLANERLLEEFNEKMTDLHYHYKAKRWQPKALQIDSLGRIVYQLLEKSKHDLRKEAGISDTTVSSNQTSTNKLLITEGLGNKIFDALVEFRQNAMLVDSNIFYEFHNKLILTATMFDTTISNSDDFATYFFRDLPISETILLLDRWQNNLLITEYNLLIFFREQIPNSWCGYYSTSPLITQSAEIVKEGGAIDVTAGVGAFSIIVARPVITIDHKNVEIDADGQAHYKISPVKKPGTYFIPVTIEYNDGFDKIVKEERVLKYTVIK